MCFETVRQGYIALYVVGFVSPFGLYAVWRFVRWIVISSIKSIVDGLHGKLFPERKQQPAQPKHDHTIQPRPQNQQHNHNRNNGQGNNNQQRPQQHFQPNQPQTQGPVLHS
jgi:hypothetical protein